MRAKQRRARRKRTERDVQRASGCADWPAPRARHLRVTNVFFANRIWCVFVQCRAVSKKRCDSTADREKSHDASWSVPTTTRPPHSPGHLPPSRERPPSRVGTGTASRAGRCHDDPRTRMSGASEETRAMASDRASTRDGHPPTTPWAVDLSCGIAAGMAYTVVAHPFDTVKVAMQSRASHLPARGTAETVRDIVRGRRGAPPPARPRGRHSRAMPVRSSVDARSDIGHPALGNLRPLARTSPVPRGGAGRRARRVRQLRRLRARPRARRATSRRSGMRATIAMCTAAHALWRRRVPAAARTTRRWRHAR